MTESTSIKQPWSSRSQPALGLLREGRRPRGVLAAGLPQRKLTRMLRHGRVGTIDNHFRTRITLFTSPENRSAVGEIGSLVKTNHKINQIVHVIISHLLFLFRTHTFFSSLPPVVSLENQRSILVIAKNISSCAGEGGARFQQKDHAWPQTQKSRVFVCLLHASCVGSCWRWGGGEGTKLRCKLGKEYFSPL